MKFLFAWRHLKTISKHRWIVFRLMCKCGYPLQGAVHDLSKFSAIEFLPSARYFQGTRSPIEAEKDEVGYSAAWMHHKGRNPHHWEYWVDFGENGEPIPARIPYKYVIEMMCDFVAAGMTYSKEAWTQEEPLRYFDKVRKGRHFHPETERLIRLYLTEIAKRGIDRACELAKNKFYNYRPNCGADMREENRMNKDINRTLMALVRILRMNGEMVKSIEAVNDWFKVGDREYMKEVAEITYDNGTRRYADIGCGSNLTAVFDVVAVIQQIKPCSSAIERIVRGVYRQYPIESIPAADD